MKTFLVLSIIFLTACTKKNHNLGPDYDQFIGVWESVNTSEKAILEFKKNGKSEISHAVERNRKFVVTNLKFWYYDSTTAWRSWNFTLGNSSSGGYSININPTQDSLTCTSLISNIIIDGTLSKPNKTAIFIKK
jgi:hypothetical protein